MKNVVASITNALLELMKSEDYDKISVTDIVNKAGLSRVTYYRHFASKEDVLIRFFKDTKERFLLQSSFGEGPINNEIMVLNLFIFFKTNMAANKAIRNAHLENELLNFLSAEFLDNLPVKLEPYYALFIAGALFNVLIHWLDNDCKDPIDEVTRPFIEVPDALAEYRKNKEAK